MIIWEDEVYSKIIRFDCHIVELETKYGGGYFTVIPISPPEYRKHTPTKARVVIEDDGGYTTFKIYCDWGQCHLMQIPNEMVEAIEMGRQGAVDNDLLE